MTHANNKVEWCLKKAEKEGRKHRGLRVTAPDLRATEQHVGKAEHNLEVMQYLMAGGFHDWAIHAAFYAQYHCLLALLAKFGFESRNQECTFAAAELLIEQGKISLEIADVYAIFATDRRDRLETTDMVELRERFQYGTETRFEKEKIQELLAQASGFLEKTKVNLQQ